MPRTHTFFFFGHAVGAIGTTEQEESSGSPLLTTCWGDMPPHLYYIFVKYPLVTISSTHLTENRYDHLRQPQKYAHTRSPRHGPAIRTDQGLNCDWLQPLFPQTTRHPTRRNKSTNQRPSVKLAKLSINNRIVGLVHKHLIINKL